MNKIKKIELLEDINEINSVYNFIKTRELNYPSYSDWIIKCYDQLLIKEKKVIAYYIYNKVIGSIIFQKYKLDNSLIEIKNFRIDENFRMRKIGSILEKKLEEYCIENSFKGIIVDTRQDNKSMNQFLQKNNYQIISLDNLYDDKYDIIYLKNINNNINK